MRREAASCRRSVAASCLWRKRLTRHWNCWTKPPQPLRRAWSGKGPGEGLSESKAARRRRDHRHPWIAYALSTNRKAIRLRVVGAAFALQAAIAFLVLWTSWGRAGIQSCPPGSPICWAMRPRAPSSCSGRAKQPARAYLRHRGAAGHHLLREPGRDPLLSRHHAADRPLGRRRDRLGDRDQPGGIASARPRTSSSASRNTRWSCGRISRRCRHRACSR